MTACDSLKPDKLRSQLETNIQSTKTSQLTFWLQALIKRISSLCSGHTVWYTVKLRSLNSWVVSCQSLEFFSCVKKWASFTQLFCFTVTTMAVTWEGAVQQRDKVHIFLKEEGSDIAHKFYCDNFLMKLACLRVHCFWNSMSWICRCRTQIRLSHLADKVN